MIKAVVFDLDDTLISERDYVISGYKHIARILSKQLSVSEQKIFNDLTNLFNESPKQVFNRLLDLYRIEYNQEYIMKLVYEYRNHKSNIKFYNDVMPCIKILQTNGVKLGLITDGSAITQRRKIEALQAHLYFKEIIITDELGQDYWKPHPKAFQLMKEKLNVDYNEMLYVGDNPKKDFYISSLVPITTVRIIRDKRGIYQNESYYGDVKEKIRINSLWELLKIINKFGG